MSIVGKYSSDCIGFGWIFKKEYESLGHQDTLGGNECVLQVTVIRVTSFFEYTKIH